MGQMSYPGEKAERLTEREKAKQTISNIESNRKGYYIEVEHPIKNYYKFKSYE